MALASLTATGAEPVLSRLTCPRKSLPGSVRMMALVPAMKVAVVILVRGPDWVMGPLANTVKNVAGGGADRAVVARSRRAVLLSRTVTDVEPVKVMAPPAEPELSVTVPAAVAA